MESGGAGVHIGSRITSASMRQVLGMFIESFLPSFDRALFYPNPRNIPGNVLSRHW